MELQLISILYFGYFVESDKNSFTSLMKSTNCSNLSSNSDSNSGSNSSSNLKIKNNSSENIDQSNEVLKSVTLNALEENLKSNFKDDSNLKFKLGLQLEILKSVIAKLNTNGKKEDLNRAIVSEILKVHENLQSDFKNGLIPYKVKFSDLYSGLIPHKTFYNIKAEFVNPKTNKNKISKETKKELVIEAIKKIKSDPFNDPVGYRFLHRFVNDLINKENYSLFEGSFHVGFNTIRKLTKSLGLGVPLHSKSRYCSYRQYTFPEPDNLCMRNFHPLVPYSLFVTDITLDKWKLAGCRKLKKVYLSPIIDSFNNEIVALGISTKRDSKKMVNETLESLYSSGLLSKDRKDRKGRKDRNNKLSKNQILHTDHGKHYFDNKFAKDLEKYNVVHSMSRRGNCLDNCKAESIIARIKAIFSRLKHNIFTSEENLYIYLNGLVHYWNYVRPSGVLNNLTPIEFRKAYCEQNNIQFIEPCHYKFFKECFQQVKEKSLDCYSSESLFFLY